MQRPTVDAALADFRAAHISSSLKATLTFLEIMTLRLMELNIENAKTVLDADVSIEPLRDAIAIGSLFNIVTRYANELDFALPTENQFDRASGMLLKRGYAS